MGNQPSAGSDAIGEAGMTRSDTRADGHAPWEEREELETELRDVESRIESGIVDLTTAEGARKKQGEMQDELVLHVSRRGENTEDRGQEEEHDVPNSIGASENASRTGKAQIDLPDSLNCQSCNVWEMGLNLRFERLIMVWGGSLLLLAIGLFIWKYFFG